MQDIRVAVVDDHVMFLEALCNSLAGQDGIQVVASVTAGKQALDMVRTQEPDVVVLDVGLPDVSGIDVARQISAEFPNIGVLGLSGYGERIFADEMIRSGALGYVIKSSSTSELVSAIRAVHSGNYYLPRNLLRREHADSESDATRRNVPSSVLTRREREVLRLIATGKSASDISAELGMTAATANVHRRNIVRKLGMRGIAALTRYAAREGIISL